MLQMRTFRQAWPGVAAVLAIDPVVLPISNVHKQLPFEMVKEAFPSITWDQPRGKRTAMLVTPRYLTRQFADLFSFYIGCSAKETLPTKEFVTEALQQPPLTFESSEAAQRSDDQGICCVCYKKGCLGRCPNPHCGLLMHYTCVKPKKNGSDVQCPVCSTEGLLQSDGAELPY